MTAQDLASRLRDSGIPCCETFLYLAAHAHELCLLNGARLLDLSDVTAFFLELAAALKSAAPMPRAHAAARIDVCPDCGHEHQGETECGEQLGGSRICRCERKVPASDRWRIFPKRARSK